jgi:hypothetical protein
MRVFMRLTAALVLMIFSRAALGADEELHRVTNAKAAAHASLSARADVPDEPPRLPDRAAQPPGKVVPDSSLRRKGDAVDRAKGQAASDAARAVREDVAKRSAQGSAASAAKSANADDHAAAGQARAKAARAGKPDHPVMPDTPGQGPKK